MCRFTLTRSFYAGPCSGFSIHITACITVMPLSILSSLAVDVTVASLFSGVISKEKLWACWSTRCWSICGRLKIITCWSFNAIIICSLIASFSLGWTLFTRYAVSNLWVKVPVNANALPWVLTLRVQIHSRGTITSVHSLAIFTCIGALFSNVREIIFILLNWAERLASSRGIHWYLHEMSRRTR